MMQQPPTTPPPLQTGPPVEHQVRQVDHHRHRDNRGIVIAVLVIIGFFGGALAVDKIREADCKPYTVGSYPVMIETTRPRCDRPLPLWLNDWVMGQGG